MNMCQIITIYLNENKHYGQKTVVTVEPGTGSTYNCVTHFIHDTCIKVQINPFSAYLKRTTIGCPKSSIGTEGLQNCTTHKCFCYEIEG